VSKSIKANIYKFLTSIGICGLMTWFYVSSKWAEGLTQSEKYCILTDGFSLPGLLLLCVAILMSISNAGGLDTLAYLMSYIPKMLVPGLLGEPDKLVDFVEKRRQNRKKGFGFLYIVGILFLGISLIFLYLFYQTL